MSTCRTANLLPVIVAFMLALFGCAPKQRVFLSLEQYTANPTAYKNNEVILTATIAQLLDNYDQYRSKRIQVSAPFGYFGHQQFWTWHIMLQEGEKKLRCYTHHYRLRAEWDAENLLLRARTKGDPITINGILYRDGIDILEIIYEDQVVRPSIKPVHIYPWIWYYPGWYFPAH